MYALWDEWIKKNCGIYYVGKMTKIWLWLRKSPESLHLFTPKLKTGKLVCWIQLFFFFNVMLLRGGIISYTPCLFCICAHPCLTNELPLAWCPYINYDNNIAALWSLSLDPMALELKGIIVPVICGFSFKFCYGTFSLILLHICCCFFVKFFLLSYVLLPFIILVCCHWCLY